MLPRFRSMLLLGSALALVTGAALLAYARWTAPLTDADGAFRSGNAAEALGAYGEGAERFRRFELSRLLLPRDFALLTHNRLALLYRQGEYDALLDAADGAPAEAAPQFWVGCALFQKAQVEQKPEAQLEWLGRAEDAFKLALADAPGDWDTKYNYELTVRLVTAMRASTQRGRQMQAAPSTMMQLLRPQPSPARQRPVRKVG